MNTHPYSPKCIFLADDDQDDRAIFAEALLDIDSSVLLTQAEDGKQLMDILHTPPDPLPDVIFLDINMPKLNGFECLEEIRSQEGDLKKINVIVFSTCNSLTSIEKAYELGATFYAVKPNTYDDLKSFIKKVLCIDWTSPEQIQRDFRLI